MKYEKSKKQRKVKPMSYLKVPLSKSISKEFLYDTADAVFFSKVLSHNSMYGLLYY